VFLGGNHPRHLYLARKLEELGYLEGVVCHDRQPLGTEEPPDDLDDELSELYLHHFDRRAKAEDEFFGDPIFPDVEYRLIQREEMNSEKMYDYVESRDPDLVLSYGIPYLTDESLSYLPEDAWNMHGGLSPQYKGAITHFWPSYLLEPQMTGVTLHQLTEDLDGGGIIHEAAGPLQRGDGLHQLACRVVKNFVDTELPRILELYEDDKLSKPSSQQWHGKMWYSRDWESHHLRVIYDKFDNQIVDEYLDGNLSDKEPDLHRQFE
jgi:methionyl-tRNA formyltransferase